MIESPDSLSAWGTYKGIVLVTAIMNWASAAPIASAMAAFIALGVTLWVANEQRRIQQKQLQQNLYDKRYAIFLAAEEFLMYVLRVDGSIKLDSDEVRRFQYAVEQAEFLFKTDVIDYMKQLKKTVFDLYPNSSKRDHLAGMNQQDLELNLKITKALMEIGGPFIETRKKVFGPYLQLSPSDLVEQSAAQMKLNGWQRLWILVAVVWMLPVLVFGYQLWPTTDDIPKADVYARMKSDDGRRLIDYYDVLAAAQYGLTPALQPSAEPTKPQTPEMKVRGQYTAADINQPKAAGQNRGGDWFAQNAPKPALPKKGPVVDIDGHTLEFMNDIPLQEMNQTSKAYYAGLRHILMLKRAAFAGEAFAAWLVPAIALYALGWAVGWVRRGFGADRLG